MVNGRLRGPTTGNRTRPVDHGKIWSVVSLIRTTPVRLPLVIAAEKRVQAAVRTRWQLGRVWLLGTRSGDCLRGLGIPAESLIKVGQEQLA
jgi:hypothetical protein